MAESDDFFAPRVSIPSISVKLEKVNREFSGVLVPVEENGRLKGYRTTDQTDQSGNVKRWPDGSVMKQAVLTLQTQLKDFDMTSEEFQARVKENTPERTDDGVRRWFVKGGGLEKPFRQAVARLGRAPQPGDVVKAKIVARVPKTARSGEKYNETQFAIEITPATDATRKVATETKVRLDAMTQVDDDDPWANEPATAGASAGGGGGYSEEPPF